MMIQAPFPMVRAIIRCLRGFCAPAFGALVAATFLAGCASAPAPEVATCAPEAGQVCPVCPVCPGIPPPPAPKVPVFEAAQFSDLPGWGDDALAESLPGLRAACARFRSQSAWQPACGELATLDSASDLRAWYERHFTPWRVSTPEGDTSGLITGYYEPLLRGSRLRHGPYQVALYAPPDDLLVIDLAAVNPDLRNMRLRGRLDGRRVVPYYSRAEIERGVAPVSGKELVWVDDPVEAFFLQIQGSGRVQLDSGELVRLGYSDQNGHPYVSVGRVLVDSGELQPGEASMQAIQAWGRSHPDRLAGMLDKNPSYVFFRELPASRDPNQGPPGAMGVPLVPMRSIAVDPRFISLGAPVYLAATWPGREESLARLMFAQDTGGAIRGPVRADFFWGFGAPAGEQAGRMRQRGKLWMLWPKGAVPRQGTNG